MTMIAILITLLLSKLQQLRSGQRKNSMLQNMKRFQSFQVSKETQLRSLRGHLFSLQLQLFRFLGTKLRCDLLSALEAQRLSFEQIGEAVQLLSRSGFLLSCSQTTLAVLMDRR
jgi:hypothetical protein